MDSKELENYLIIELWFLGDPNPLSALMCKLQRKPQKELNTSNN